MELSRTCRCSMFRELVAAHLWSIYLSTDRSILKKPLEMNLTITVCSRMRVFHMFTTHFSTCCTQLPHTIRDTFNTCWRAYCSYMCREFDATENQRCVAVQLRRHLLQMWCALSKLWQQVGWGCVYSHMWYVMFVCVAICNLINVTTITSCYLGVWVGATCKKTGDLPYRDTHMFSLREMLTVSED